MHMYKVGFEGSYTPSIIKKFPFQNITTVRPQDTWLQAAWTLHVHILELGPKNVELNKFM